MLQLGSKPRGARGSASRSTRGSRGRGGMSRGALNSSSKSKTHNNVSPLPTGPRALQASSSTSNFRGAGQKLQYQKNNRSSTRTTGPSPNTPSPDIFEQARLENAAKREQKGQQQSSTMVNGRGGRGAPRGLHSNKQVRFTDFPEEQKSASFTKAASQAPSNPFGSSASANANLNVSPAPPDTNGTFNPFAPKQNATTNSNPFAPQSTTSNSFGVASQQKATTSIFGMPSGPQNGTASPNPFGAPSHPTASNLGVFGMSSENSKNPPTANPFGAPTGPKANGGSTNPFNNPPTTFNSSKSPLSNAFGAAPQTTTGFAIASTNPKSSFAQPVSNSFGAPTNGNAPKFSQTPSGASNAFGSRPSVPSNGALPKPNLHGISTKQSVAPSTFSAQPAARPNGTASNAAAVKIDQLLRKERLIAPSWPTLPPNDPGFKSAIETYWRASKDYRNKVRACLIRAGIFDDPDKPKKLSEAIDFNGICEGMCPEFEKANRIYERNVMGAETEVGPDGQSYPAPHKMIKAFARSAAGQDAPLPMDVRSPAALTKTLDYLFQSVLGNKEENLPKVHHFLWDRTREIRRDFVFQQASMNASELPDQIYCLEHITRFHVIALHQMSRDGVSPAEEFSEQQEVEQLGKTLLSLMQTYEDCKIQGVECGNEAEFRSYYALLNSGSPGILQTVQDWGWKYWGESDQIRTAVTLIEALQNTWDSRGPLKPQATMDVAQNAFSRFFTIVADKKVSYTMACFAEIHFNGVRKSILKTILASYRKQRDQTKDWTLSKLNDYLRFDDEDDIVAFGEAYGLRFDEVDGEECLAFESEGVSDPFPQLKQRHSYDLVERKRGHHSLLEVIYTTVYDESEEILMNGEDHDTFEEESLFVTDDSPAPQDKPNTFPTPATESLSNGQENTESTNSTKPASLFDRISQPKPFANDFFSKPPAQAPAAQLNPPLFFQKAPESEVTAAPLIAKQPDSPFSFTKKLETPSPFAKPDSIPTFTPQPETSTPFSNTPGSGSITSKQPSKEPPSVLEQSTSTQQPSPSIFNFGQPPSNTTSGSSSQTPLSLGNYAVSATPAEATKPPLFPSSQSPLPQTSLFNKVSTPLPTQAPPSVFSSVQKESTSVPPQFEAPKPFQNNSQTSGEPSKINPAIENHQPQKLDRRTRLDGVAHWVALGSDGLLDHFIENTVDEILWETVRLFNKQQYEKAIKEADELARNEAYQFRLNFLHTKYFTKWRQGARHLWQKRQGRENRRAMREMAESMRASKVTQSANIVQDFRASTTSNRRDSLESLLDATGILNGVHDSKRQIRKIVQDDDEATSLQGQEAERPIKKPTSSVVNMHRRGKSDDPRRRSMMSDSSYLNGGSRIHLMTTYDDKNEKRRQVSGVQTDYFRLKSRGIATLPDGTPLATSAAKDYLREKRSFDGITKSSTPQRSSYSSIPRSVPSKYAIEPRYRESSIEHVGSIKNLKGKARAVVSGDGQIRRKRSFDEDNDDEALFERAKRVREQMDEGSKWYRKEIERNSNSRSMS